MEPGITTQYALVQAGRDGFLPISPCFLCYACLLAADRNGQTHGAGLLFLYNLSFVRTIALHDFRKSEHPEIPRSRCKAGQEPHDLREEIGEPANSMLDLCVSISTFRS
jgi:hypothetical protein